METQVLSRKTIRVPFPVHRRSADGHRARDHAFGRLIGESDIPAMHFPRTADSARRTRGPILEVEQAVAGFDHDDDSGARATSSLNFSAKSAAEIPPPTMQTSHSMVVGPSRSRRLGSQRGWFTPRRPGRGTRSAEWPPDNRDRSLRRLEIERHQVRYDVAGPEDGRASARCPPRRKDRLDQRPPLGDRAVRRSTGPRRARRVFERPPTAALYRASGRGGVFCGCDGPVAVVHGDAGPIVPDPSEKAFGDWRFAMFWSSVSGSTAAAIAFSSAA